MSPWQQIILMVAAIALIAINGFKMLRRRGPRRGPARAGTQDFYGWYPPKYDPLLALLQRAAQIEANLIRAVNEPR